MGKIIERYNILKKQNFKLLYLFKSGLFYIFVDNDAKYISKKYDLKLTSFGNSYKCGFPINALDKYLNIFSNESIEIANEKSDVDNSKKIYNVLNKVDLNKITPLEALKILYKIKEINNE